MNLRDSSLVLRLLFSLIDFLQHLAVSSFFIKLLNSLAVLFRSSYFLGWMMLQGTARPLADGALIIRTAGGGLNLANKSVINPLSRWLNRLIVSSQVYRYWETERERWPQAPVRWLGFFSLSLAAVYMVLSFSLPGLDHPLRQMLMGALLVGGVLATQVRAPWIALSQTSYLWQTGQEWLGEGPQSVIGIINPMLPVSPWLPLGLGWLLGAGLYWYGLTFLVLLVLIGGLALLVAYPVLGLFLLAAYAVIDPFLRLTGNPLASVWDELLFFTLLVVWVIHAVRIGRLHARLGLVGWPMLFFIGIALFRYLMPAPHPQVSLEGLRVVIQFILWYYVTVNLLDNPRQVKALVGWLLVLMIGISLYGIYQYITKVPVPAEWFMGAYETSVQTRAFSIVGSPNILGSLLALTFPLSLGLLVSQRSWKWRVILLAVAGILGLCLLMTLSRGAWLAVGAGLIVLGLMIDRRVVIGLVIFSLLIPVALPTVYDRIAFMTSAEYMASSEKDGRIARWTQTISEWERHPVIGQGYGEVGGAVAARTEFIKGTYTDSYYIKTGAEMGVLGLVAMLWLFLTVLRAGSGMVCRLQDPWLRGLAGGMMAGLVAVIIHNSVENVFEVPMMVTYFWLVAGILVSLVRVEGIPENRKQVIK